MSNTATVRQFKISEGNPATDITFNVTEDEVEIIHGSGKDEIIGNQVYPGKACKSKTTIECARMLYRNYISIGFRAF